MHICIYMRPGDREPYHGYGTGKPVYIPLCDIGHHRESDGV